jgi:hypothetical protein
MATTLERREGAMYLSVVFVYALILVLVSPVMWVAWWLLADLGEWATRSDTGPHSPARSESRRWAL